MVDRIVLSIPASIKLNVGRQRALPVVNGAWTSRFFGRLGGARFDSSDKSRPNPDGGGTVHQGSGDASTYDQKSGHQQTKKTRPAM
jgi:hypothetical protein